MSGFRKFRTTLHRRRRSIEAVELGYLTTGAPREPATRLEAASAAAGGEIAHALEGQAEGSAAPLEFSVSAEAREIGPNPIGWLKPKRPESDN